MHVAGIKAGEQRNISPLYLNLQTPKFVCLNGFYFCLGLFFLTLPPLLVIEMIIYVLWHVAMCVGVGESVHVCVCICVYVGHYRMTDFSLLKYFGL